MLNYDEFKEVVMVNFKDYFSDPFKTMKSFEKVEANKVNETKEAIAVRDGEKGMLVYLDVLYHDYQTSLDLEDVLSNAAKMVQTHLERAEDVLSCFKREKFKEQIRCRLINTKLNRKLLEDAVYREFNDLSVICQWCVRDEGVTYSITIRTGMAEKFGMSEEEMFQTALQNTKRMCPLYMENMASILLHVFQGIEIPKELLEDGEKVYVISNEEKRNGAVCMLYEDYFHELAEKWASDLYILPSSVHEVIAFPVELSNTGDPNELADLVKCVNDETLDPEERLSDSVYLYSRKDRKISILAEA